jgi:cell shape-determining protein MreC
MAPKGIVIGRVTRIRREGVTKVADIRPTVKPETVEYVFVIPAGE